MMSDKEYKKYFLENKLKEVLDEIFQIKQYKKDNNIVYSDELDSKLNVLNSYKEDFEKQLKDCRI